MMVSLNNSSWAISLASLDYVSALIKYLKDKLFAILVVQGSDRDVLQRNDPLGCSLCSVLKVVQAPII